MSSGSKATIARFLEWPSGREGSSRRDGVKCYWFLTRGSVSLPKYSSQIRRGSPGRERWSEKTKHVKKGPISTTKLLLLPGFWKQFVVFSLYCLWHYRYCLYFLFRMEKMFVCMIFNLNTKVSYHSEWEGAAWKLLEHPQQPFLTEQMDVLGAIRTCQWLQPTKQ